jgi:hypothetical protein
LSSTAYLPIHAPYHADHLYCEEDVEAILAHVEADALLAKATSTPVVSFGQCHAVWASTYKAALADAIRDILIRPIAWDRSVAQLGTLLHGRPAISIMPIGTHSADSLQRLLTKLLPDVDIAVAPETGLPSHTISSGDGQSTHRCGRAKLAVVGMSGRFPGANNPQALWDLLMQKKDMCKEVPPLRWDVNTHVDPTGKTKNTSKVRFGCWLDEADLFDAKFFCMSPREAAVVDPAQRLALMTAYEAIEDAGIVPGRTPSTREDRVGVFYGTASSTQTIVKTPLRCLRHC